MERTRTNGDDTSDEQNFANCFTYKHVVLPKSHMLQAIDAILETPKKPVGKISKVSQSFSTHANPHKIVSLCTDKSHLLGYGRFVYKAKHKSKHNHSLLPILNEMRLCLLAKDWDNYKKLLLILFESPNLPKSYILYAVRSCFVLLLNHPKRTAEMLDNFITACLHINEESRKIQYLKDCFTHKAEHLLNTEIANGSGDENEEIFFNSDYSSD